MNPIRLTAIVLLLTVVAACQSVPKSSSKDGSPEASMSGFSWVITDQLAAMPAPGGSRDLAEDLDYIAGQGISTLVSLTEESIDMDRLDRHDLIGYHIPVKDYTAPTLLQMHEFVKIVSLVVARGERAAVHCTAGLGRSGTMVAAYFVNRGLEANDAIAKIRRLRPDSIETAGQEQAVRDYMQFLKEKDD